LVGDREFWKLVKRQHNQEINFSDALNKLARGELITDLVLGSGRLTTASECLKANQLQTQHKDWLHTQEFYQAVCDLLRAQKEFG